MAHDQDIEPTVGWDKNTGERIADYTCFPERGWNGREALLELERSGKILRVTITADGNSASRAFTEAEAEELAGALARIYRNIRLA